MSTTTLNASDIAIVANRLHDRPFQETIELARSAGARHVEYPHAAWPGTSIIDQAKALADADLSCRVVSLPARVGRIGEPERQAENLSLASGAIQTAHGLGADHIQLHTLVPSVADYSRIVTDLAEQLRPICHMAGDLGVGVLLENNFDSRGEDAHGINPARHGETMMQLAEAIDQDNFGFCYDPINFLLTGGRPHPDEFEAMATLIRNVHVKDCKSVASTSADRDRQRGELATDTLVGAFEWVPLGSGEMDWPSVLSALANLSYGGPLTIEPVTTRTQTLGEWTLDAAPTLLSWLTDHDQSKA